VLSQERLRLLVAARQTAKLEFDIRVKELEETGTKNALALVDAQRALIQTQIDERLGIAQYNIALADFERLKGTLLAHDNVTISDGPLPACVEARASAHIRERQHAVTIRERPEDCGCDNHGQPCGGTGCGTCGAAGVPLGAPGQPLPQQAAPAAPSAEPLSAPLPAKLPEPKKSVLLDRPAATPLPVSRYPDLTPQR
jgi:hypothetical protein